MWTGALSTIYGFLKYNTPLLVTLDIMQHIARLLGNGLGLVNASISIHQGQAVTVAGPNGILQVDGKAVSSEMRLHHRVYECFRLLSFTGITDST